MSVAAMERRRMMRCCVSAAAGAIVVAGAASPAIAQSSRLTVDVEANGGVDSNPLLLPDGKSTGFFEFNVAPRFVMPNELGEASIDGHYRRTEYFRGIQSTEAYGGSASTRQRLGPRWSFNAALAYDSSIIGQANDTGLSTTLPTLPVDPTPVIGSPDISLLGLRQRQSTLRANAGFADQMSARDTLTGGVGVAQVRYDGSRLFPSFRTYDANLAYQRSLSESTQVGASASGQWTDYQRGNFSGAIYQPQLTVTTRFNPRWTLTAAGGLLILRSRNPLGSDSSVGFSGSAQLCDRHAETRLCINAYRDGQASGPGYISRRIGASASYYYRPTEHGSLNASVDYSRLSSTIGAIGSTTDSSYFTANANYNHQVARRLTIGTAISYREGRGIVKLPSDVRVLANAGLKLGEIH